MLTYSGAIKLFGLAKVQSDVFFVMNRCTVTRGHKYKLYKVTNIIVTSAYDLYILH